MALIIFSIIIIGSILFYFFYFWDYSLWYCPSPKHLDVFAPDQPLNGPGGKDYKTDKISIKRIVDEEGFEVYLFYPEGVDLNSAPVIVMLHGLSTFSETTYQGYYKLISHEVKRGNIVIFPIYQKNFFHPFFPKTFPKKAEKLIQLALEELKKTVPENNFANSFIVIGISMGGSVATHIANQNTLPSPKALILITPGEKLPLIPSQIFGLPFKNLSNLNKNTFVTVLFAQNDRLIPFAKIKKKILKLTQGIENKHMFLIPSDTYGNPPLWSNHMSSYFVNNALNYYGYWKIIDATISCSLLGKYCEIAKGESEEVFYMGKWSDGKEINKIKKIY